MTHTHTRARLVHGFQHDWQRDVLGGEMGSHGLREAQTAHKRRKLARVSTCV
jgi:hypothetical protein